MLVILSSYAVPDSQVVCHK